MYRARVAVWSSVLAISTGCSGPRGDEPGAAALAGADASESVDASVRVEARSPAAQALELAARSPDLAPRVRGEPGAWVTEEDVITSPGWRAAKVAEPYALGARLPMLADGPVRVGVGRADAFTVSLAPVGARSARFVSEASLATYRDVWPSTDLVWVADSARVEALLILRDGAAPTSFSWSLSLPSSLPTLREEASGSLAFADAAGQTRLRIPRAFAVDARGVRRDAELAYREGRLVVTLDPRGLEFPVLLDPAVETPAWLDRTPPPGQRAFHVMTFDSTRGKTLLFGGGGADTVSYDGVAWTQVATTGPSGGSGLAMAFDALRGRAVLLAGGATWEWDGTTWTQRATSGPTSRGSSAMAFDGARGKVVLFGGYGATSPYYLGDTWEWDGTTWTQVATTGPSARSAHALAYDAARGRTVLFGGNGTSGKLGDTWEWDGTTWTQVATTGPQSRYTHSLAYDSVRGKSVLYGGYYYLSGYVYLGDTWEWDGATWTQRASTGPTPRNGSALAFDAARGKTVLYGGYVGNGGGWGSNENDTWEWDGTSWKRVVTGPVERS